MKKLLLPLAFLPLLFVSAHEAAAQYGSTAPAPPQDNQYITKNGDGALTTGQGDASTYCPGPSQDVNGAPGTSAAAGAIWGANNPQCGPSKNIQNLAGYAVWQPENSSLPLDIVGTPVTAVTVTGSGANYASGQIVSFAHGTTATVTGGSSTNPILTVTNPGNWGCITAGSSSQAEVSQVGNTGAGTGAIFTLTTPGYYAWGTRQMTYCSYDGGAAAVVQAVNGFTSESPQTINFLNGVWDQGTADGYCALAQSGFTASATWASGVNPITISGQTGQTAQFYRVSGPGIGSGNYIFGYSSGSTVLNLAAAPSSGSGGTITFTPTAAPCFVTTWKDQGPFSADLTNTVPNAPNYPLDRYFQGLRPLVFSGARNSPPAKFTEWLQNTSVGWNYSSFTLIIVGRVANTRETRGIFGSTGSNSYVFLSGAFNGTAGFGSTLTTNTSGTVPCAVGPDDNIGIFGITSNGLTETCFNGASSATLSEATVTTPTGIVLGANTTTQATWTAASNMDVLAAVFYPFALTNTQRLAIEASLSAEYNVPIQYNNVVLWAGDSTGVNGSVTDTTFPQKAQAMTNRPAKFINIAISGDTASNAIGRIASGECIIYSSYGGAQANSFIEGFTLGPNDIRGGATAAQVEGYLQTYVATVLACAPKAKIIAGVPMLQGDIAANSGQKATLTALNTWLEACYNIPQNMITASCPSGGLGAFGIADFWREPTVGGSSGTSVFNTSGPNLYSLDNQHFSDYGQSFMAGVWAKALNGAM